MANEHFKPPVYNPDLHNYRWRVDFEFIGVRVNPENKSELMYEFQERVTQ